MKEIILFLLFMPTLCFAQRIKNIHDSSGINNDTIYFDSFKVISYDTAFIDIDIDYPSKLVKFELSSRFKVSSDLIKKIEKNIFSDFVNCNKYFIKYGELSYTLHQTEIDSIRKNAKLKYSEFDRRYFGYFDSTGIMNVIIKFVPKQPTDFTKIAALPNLSFITLATLNYNTRNGYLCFANN